MRTSLLILLICLSIFQVCAQDLSFDIHGKYTRPVKKEKLESANLIRDFVPGYASGWITEYISVEIVAVSNGKVMKAAGRDEKLTAGQRGVLHAADLLTQINVNVDYKSLNSATGISDNRSMRLTMTVVPDIEAEFTGGAEKMRKYLKESAIDKIDNTVRDYILNGIIAFTVDERGKITNVKLTKSTGDPGTDRLLMEGISKMPDWRPAAYSSGKRVSQDFEFSVGNKGC